MTKTQENTYYTEQATFATAYRFEVELGTQSVGFKSLSGLKMERAFEAIAVGGKNDGPVMLPAPLKEAGRLTFERGRCNHGGFLRLYPGQGFDTIAVSIKDESGNAAVSYAISGAVVESIELSALDGTSSDMLIEKLVLLHHGIMEEKKKKG